MSSAGERYPGMKALATRLFTECPRSKHGELSRQMKYFLETAKARGTATSMDWNSQNLYTLKKLFGSPPKFPGTVPVSTGSTKQHTNTTPNKSTRNITEPVKINRDVAMNGSPSNVRMKQNSARKLNQPLRVQPVKTQQEHHASNNSQNGKPSQNNKVSPPKKSAAELRRERFQSPASGMAVPYQDSQIIGTVVGTNTQLEKPFFRLTAQVNPAAVRPPEVIAQALPFVLSKYQEGKGYSYATSQLQSIRQDLTVQHVESQLTVFVYEINARMALFHDDLGEFNKCLTRLTDLYDRNPNARQNQNEFKAYSVYYMLLRHKWDELSLFLQQLNPDSLLQEASEVSRPDTSELSTFSPTGNLYPNTVEDQSAMLGRALMCIHYTQQLDLFSLIDRYGSAWPLEKKLLNQTVQLERARALEALLVATKQQNQSLPLSQIRVWLRLSSEQQLEELLTTWKIPYHAQEINSEEALSSVQKVSASLGAFDLKGQI